MSYNACDPDGLNGGCSDGGVGPGGPDVNTQYDNQTPFGQLTGTALTGGGHTDTAAANAAASHLPFGLSPLMLGLIVVGGVMLLGSGGKSK